MKNEFENVKRLIENIAKVIVGKKDKIERIVMCLLARGHILIEDLPGTGKTVLAKTLARSIDAEYSRIQFTPDLLPTDITGINFYNPKESEFVLRKGPAFCNILLADEINRATPRTQSALLECMAEGQISIDGTTYDLEKPFFVIATQNPIETSGTFPLPEAQLDRFAMKIEMGSTTLDNEIRIIRSVHGNTDFQNVEPVLTVSELIALQDAAKRIYVHPLLVEYVARLVMATREDRELIAGASARGSIALVELAKAKALIENRDFVIPEDIKEIATEALAHRIITAKTGLQVGNAKKIIEGILHSTEVPTEEWNRL